MLLILCGALAGPVRAAGWAPAGSLPGLGSGKIWQLAFAPGNPQMVAAATDDGVYLSSDAGDHWATAGLQGSRVWTVAFAVAGNPVPLYAGLAGKGFRASVDDGATWTNDSTGLPNLDVRALAVTQAGLAVGTDDGVALSRDGATWYAGGLAGDSISALAGVANPSGPFFFAGVDYPNTGMSFMYRRDPTTAAWSPIGTGLPSGDVVTSISIGPTSQTVTINPLLVTTSKGTFRSGDGGSNWSASTGLPQGTYLTDASFSPLDPNLVYAGADASGSSGGGLFRSTDSGQTFATANQGLPTNHGPNEPARQEVESVAVAPGTPYATVVAALDPYQGSAGVYRELDSSAPSPPALTTVTGPVATLPAGGAPTPQPAASAPSRSGGAKPAGASSPLIAQVVGTIVHFPTPLVFELAFILLAVGLYIRWRRHYYVEGPP